MLVWPSWLYLVCRLCGSFQKKVHLQAQEAGVPRCGGAAAHARKSSCNSPHKTHNKMMPVFSNP